MANFEQIEQQEIKQNKNTNLNLLDQAVQGDSNNSGKIEPKEREQVEPKKDADPGSEAQKETREPIAEPHEGAPRGGTKAPETLPVPEDAY